LCGPLPRTRQTAQAIAAACGVSAQPAPALDELGLGAWQGLTKTEIAARYPTEWRLWCERPEQLAFPGFEPLHEVAARVTTFLSGIHRSCPDGDVVVVTH
jgi:broad specificity phosphatase PhoE